MKSILKINPERLQPTFTRQSFRRKFRRASHPPASGPLNHAPYRAEGSGAGSRPVRRGEGEKSFPYDEIQKPYSILFFELIFLLRIKIIIPEKIAIPKATNKGKKEVSFGICSPIAANPFSSASSKGFSF